MQWIVVIVIGLCWCEVDAKRTDAAECRRNMLTDWHDTRYTPIQLSDEDMAYFQSTDIGDRADAPPGVRQECRTMSDGKRNALWAAFRWMMSTRETANGPTRFQVFIAQHRFTISPSAHFGPCFLPWHRVFLRRLEVALQSFNPTVSLCYWDSSLDSPLPDAAQSCLWTAEYFGNGQGFVTTGFAANQPAYPPQDCGNNWPRLYREAGGNQNLMNQNKINALYSAAASYTQLVRPYQSCNMENFHGEVHAFVGGHMSSISCSPQDPVFWLHHAFVDYLWDNCRRRQTTDIQQDYPTDSGVPQFHRANDEALPFGPLVCRDGLSTSYVPGSYTYAASPGACTTHDECGGKALWCNNGRCMACVGPNGRMGANWPSVACYITGCNTPRNVNQVCRCAQ